MNYIFRIVIYPDLNFKKLIKFFILICNILNCKEKLLINYNIEIQ